MPEAQTETMLTVAQWWRDIVHRHGDQTFLCHNDVAVTGAALEARSAAAARGLLSIGCGKGTRIGLLMPNGADWIVSWLAIERIGALAINLSTFFSAPELGYALRQADVAVLLSAPSYLSNDYADRLEQSCPAIAAADGSRPLALATLPYLRSVWFTRDNVRPWQAGSLPGLEQQGAASPLFTQGLLQSVEACVAPGDPGMMIFTSGSTANPKAVVHTHDTITHKIGFLAAANSIIPAQMVRGDRVLINSPFFWVGGFLNLLGSLFIGATVFCQDDHAPRAIVEAIRKHDLTHVDGDEAVLRAIEAQPGAGRELMARLKVAHTHQNAYFATLHGLDRRCALGAIGMSETLGPHSGVPGQMVLACPSAGALGHALGPMEYRLVDPETRKAVAPGQAGELLVRGRWLMDSFYKVPRRDTFDADGFYATGDLCHLDEHGMIHFEARLSGMIKTSGANVAPEEVEQALAGHDKVISATVFGVASERLGQMVVAVIGTSSSHMPDAAELKTFLREQVSVFKIPKEFIFIPFDQLPLTASKKIDKRALQARYAAKSSATVPPA